MEINYKEVSSICRCAAKTQSTEATGSSLITDVPIDKPDLAIYSQTEMLAQGKNPSWDNPDIDASAVVRVRNLSTTVPASNVMVNLYTSPFGIGTKKTLKDTWPIHIAQGKEATLSFQKNLQEEGHGLHVEIIHPHDSNLDNNFGSQVFGIKHTSETGRNFNIDIPVYNDSPMNRKMTFSVLPTNLITSLSTLSSDFLPHQQKNLQLKVSVPSTISGSPGPAKESEVTVIGRLPDNTLIGGITYFVMINT